MYDKCGCGSCALTAVTIYVRIQGLFHDVKNNPLEAARETRLCVRA